MTGWTYAAPTATFASTADRDPTSQVAVDGHANAAQSSRDWEVRIRVTVPAGAPNSVFLVNGSYTINPAGTSEQLPEASTFEIAAGETREFDFSMAMAPFHVLHPSTGAAVNGVRTRVGWRNSNHTR